MTVHQYIGARYVPYYYQNSLDPTSTEWEPNVHYEALTVVTLSNGHSYISKKDVPDTIGTPASNAEYWLDTGSDNAYIQNLQDQIDIINDDLTDNIHPDITQAQTDIEYLMPLRRKKYLFIGDSYGDDNGEWVEKLVGFLDLSASDYYKLCTGGHGFTGKNGAGSGPQGPTLEWKTDLTNFVGAHTADELAEISDVYIIGGFNDIYDTQASIETFMSAFFTYAKANLPNAKFFVGLAGWAGQTESFSTPNQTFSGDQARIALVQKVLPAYENAAKYGATYMGDLFLCLHNYNTDFDATYYHPTSAAGDKLATAIASFINNGTFKVDINGIPQVITKGGTDVTMGNCDQHGDLITIFAGLGPSSFVVVLAADQGAAGEFDSGWTFKSGLIGGHNGGSGNNLLRGDFWTGSELIPGYVFFKNTGVYCVTTKALTAGSYQFRLKTNTIDAHNC